MHSVRECSSNWPITTHGSVGDSSVHERDSELVSGGAIQAERGGTIRLLIGRYLFGREFDSETMVIIRNTMQVRKGLAASPRAHAVTRGLAISLISAIL